MSHFVENGGGSWSGEAWSDLTQILESCASADGSARHPAPWLSGSIQSKKNIFLGRQNMKQTQQAVCLDHPCGPRSLLAFSFLRQSWVQLVYVAWQAAMFILYGSPVWPSPVNFDPVPSLAGPMVDFRLVCLSFPTKSVPPSQA